MSSVSGQGHGRAALILAGLVLFSSGIALFGGFVWDDLPLIVENRWVQNPDQLVHILTSSFWETGDRYDRFWTFFRPVVTLSYVVDHAIWGRNPFGFHLTNLLLHLGCCWLVYWIALREGLNWPAAVTGGAFFALHPVHVESIAWISGRTDLLCGLFLLAGFAAYRGGTTRRHRLASAGLFALALFSKEMAAMLPILIAAHAWFASTGKQRRFGPALAATAPHLMVFVGYMVARSAVLREASTPLFELGIAERISTTIFVLARYVTLLLLPIRLDAHHPYAPRESLLQPIVLMGALVLTVVFFAGRKLSRTSPRSAFWLFWIFISLTPVMAFGRFGDVLMADRFLYIPSVGLALLAAYGTEWLARAPRPSWFRPAIGTCATILLLLGVATVQRSTVWKDDLTLFSGMVKTSPASAMVRNNLGLAMYQRGDYFRATREFRLATDLASGYTLAHNNLAAALEREGRLEEALEEYLLAIRQAPRMVEPAANAGNLMVRLGRTREGLALLGATVERHPEYAPALFALAEALYQTGNLEDAGRLLARAVASDDRFPQAHYLAGKIDFELGRRADAAQHMEIFLDLWPDEGEHTAAARRILAEAITADGPADPNL